ncbi:hypothetical protein BGZ57DRAFT_861701 [Hyaloscypha finlandica]|nr:hypothetical protein BGZ57DRAFT_861701 [Hyaloscypha finlandica]
MSQNLLSGMSAFPLVLLLCILNVPTATHSLPLSPSGYLNNTLPHTESNSLTLKEDIKCYALPFGAFGFISHLMTYWTIALNAEGLSPWRFKKLKHKKRNKLLAVGQLLWTVAMAIYTMANCHRRWQFIVMGFWHLTLSITLSIVSIMGGAENIPDPLYTTGIYAVGVIVGIPGLISLVVETWKVPHVQGLTTTWAAILVVFGFTGTLFSKQLHQSTLVMLPATIAATCAFFSDWLYAAIAGNYWGVPNDAHLNKFISITYFIAKRLPFSLTLNN